MTSFLWTLYAWFFVRFTRLFPYQELLDEVLVKLDPLPNQTILDAGCGPGALTIRLFVTCPTAKVWAVDFSSGMLNHAYSRATWPKDWKFLHSDLDRFLDKSSIFFDRIACVNVLWTLPDPQKTLIRLAAHLAPGGRMVLAIPKKRFRADIIFRRHLAQQIGWKYFWALLSLSWLLMGVFVNLLLVILSILKGVKRQKSNRFHSQHFKALYESAGLSCDYEGPCYADQDFLFVFSKR